MCVCKRIRAVGLKDTRYLPLEEAKFPRALGHLTVLSRYCRDECKERACAPPPCWEAVSPTLLCILDGFLHCIQVAKKHLHLCVGGGGWQCVCEETSPVFQRPLPPESHIRNAFKVGTSPTAAQNRPGRCVVITTNTMI